MVKTALLYVTFSSLCEAEKVIKLLIEEKLAVCGNILPCKSVYDWNSKITEDDEVLMFVKTSIEKSDNCVSKIKELHSYDVPLVAKIDTDTNKEYFDWMNSMLR